MLELGIYENIKTLARKIRKKQDLDQVDELAAAAFTGGVTAYLTTPLDVIKTKLMMQVRVQVVSVHEWGLRTGVHFR